ncbi:hypothetical protein RI367_001739 [Sorochytrium milnesiophthora]
MSSAAVREFEYNPQEFPTMKAKDSPYNPTHPGLFHVVFGDNLRSKLVADRAFAAGSVVAEITTATPAPKRYTSVQFDEHTHIELNSDLVYMNHSCNPSIYIDTKNRRTVALRDLKEGDEMTFFYPSTEWDMTQPFECWCGSTNCVRLVKGAKHLTDTQASAQRLNEHIVKLRSEAANAQ